MAAEPTLGDALRRAQTRLEESGVEAPRIQAVALAGHVLGLDRAGVLAASRDPLSRGDASRLLALVERRADHEPLQYLLGRAWFLDFELSVGPGVFIPRPETEGLVESALAVWPEDRPMAVDLCTGSGAVAIALARARPRSRVLAVELSPVAAAAARANVRALGVDDRVTVVRADLLTALRAGADIGVLVCNPPYAPRAEVVQPEVRDHEPEMAWSGGERGTEVYERLAGQAAAALRPGRPLVLELGYGQEHSVPAILRGDGRWTEPLIEKDFQEIPRVLTVCRA